MKTVLITGGSSGIGLEMSRHFARAGYRLIWVSKPPEELAAAKARLITEFRSVAIDTLSKDLSLLQAAREVYDWTVENGWQIDVLINNAGFGSYGFCNEIDSKKELDMIHLNIVNVYQLTRLFLSDMMKRNDGTIINISSNSSFQPVPRMNTYASTKAFVTHFSRGLREELKLQGSNVRIMTICPAAIQDTAFKVTGKMEQVKTFNGLAFTTAKEVASDVWKNFNGGKDFVVTGAKMRLFYLLHGLVPYRLQQFLVQKETEIEKGGK